MAKQLNLKTYITYALPALALAAVGLPIYVYLPKFYVDVVGVSTGAAALIFGGIRLFDGVTDPIIGWLSDRTKTRFGRRRPWIFLGSILLAVPFIALFMPPTNLGDSASLWLGAALILTFLFFTVVLVPYEALGPELTYDYNERTTLLGWREGLLLVGTVVAVMTPVIIQTTVQNVPLTEDCITDNQFREQFALMAWIYAPLLILLCGLCAWRIKENQAHRPVAPSNPFKDVLKFWGNKPFRILLLSYAVAALGSNLPGVLIPFYAEYVLGTANYAPYLILYFVVGIFILPLWLLIAKRLGKKPTWFIAIAINTVAFSMVFFLQQGDESIYAILVCISGIGLGATLAIPVAMQADVIDYEELRSGERAEGRMIAVWSIAKKFSAAAGVGLGLFVLGLTGYTEAEAVTNCVAVVKVSQPESAVFGLRVLYALVPAGLSLLGLALAWRYPISETVHSDIRQAIADKDAGNAWRDPLA